jgi:hypothetical protein
MATTKSVKVADLKLDLKNFRTVHQPDEEHAVNALIAIHPNYFWGLMESLLDDGYSTTENIIVIERNGKNIVKEGNRRIASLKLIEGLIKDVELPEHIQKRIDALTEEWRAENESVPCAIYGEKEAALVDKLVARTHAKGETSGRDKWTAVARARFARDQNSQPEPALDLLEAYLKSGKNLSPQQAERWGGEYPITVLDEAIQKLTPLLGFKSPADLTSHYPKKHKLSIDLIIFDIGTSTLGFKDLRATTPFWGSRYGVEPTADGSARGRGTAAGASTATPPGENAGEVVAFSAGVPGRATSKAHASNDPKSVRNKIRSFKVRGIGREKIATLLNEIKTLKLEEHPHAFCFLLRSIFELSAKAYCADLVKSGGPHPKKKDGTDKPLAALLREIVENLTGNCSDKAKTKILHGSITELAKTDGILSVTSLNQLIHNPSFSIAPSDICIVFGNVFPLLEEMNG